MDITVIGASGIVGQELISILEHSKLNIKNLKLYASSKSKGKTVNFKGEEISILELSKASDIKADIVFFATSAKVAKEYAHIATKNGSIVIDKSSAFRMEKEVNLVVPEVNSDELCNVKRGSIVASPNCVCTPLVQVLSPLHRAFGIKKVIVSTYQAVSGAGNEAILELETQVRDLFNLRENKPQVFEKQIAFNCLPLIPAKTLLDDEGISDEENKICEETRKILKLPKLAIDVTAVRVPVFNGHSMSVYVECENNCTREKALDILSSSKGIIVVDDLYGEKFASPIDASGKDETMVSRIRVSKAFKYGLSFWITSDNLRTGAGLNAVKIAVALNLEKN